MHRPIADHQAIEQSWIPGRFVEGDNPRALWGLYGVAVVTPSPPASVDGREEFLDEPLMAAKRWSVEQVAQKIPLYKAKLEFRNSA